MKTLSKTILTVLATGVISCGLLTQQAQAGAILFTDNLQHLVDTQGSIGIGDKVFNNFDFTTGGLTGFNASGVIVTATVDNTGTYFLTYTGTLGGLVSATGPAVADLLLRYTVTATAGQIGLIDQQYTGGIAPLGAGFLTIDETASFGGTVFGNSHLEINDFSDPPVETGDNLIINPAQTILNVQKDIGYFITAATGGVVSVSIVAQSFHQTVPDGGSAVALLGIALAGIEGARRIFRARKG